MEENKTYDVVETGTNDVYYLTDSGKSGSDFRNNAAMAAGGLGLLITLGKIAYDKFIGEPKKKKAMEAAINEKVAEVITDANDKLVKELKELFDITERSDEDEIVS